MIVDGDMMRELCRRAAKAGTLAALWAEEDARGSVERDYWVPGDNPVPEFQSTVAEDPTDNPTVVGLTSRRITPGRRIGSHVLSRERIAVWAPSDRLTDRMWDEGIRMMAAACDLPRLHASRIAFWMRDNLWEADFDALLDTPTGLRLFSEEATPSEYQWPGELYGVLGFDDVYGDKDHDLELCARYDARTGMVAWRVVNPSRGRDAWMERTRRDWR